MLLNKTGWPSGLRRQIKALVSSEAWVRIPLQSNLFSFHKSDERNCLVDSENKLRFTARVTVEIKFVQILTYPLQVTPSH